MTLSRRRSGAKLYEIRPDGNAADIPAALHRLADQIADGEHGDVMTVCLVLEHQSDVMVSGFGNIDGMRCIGLLSYGLAKLNAMTREAVDTEE